MSKTVHTSHVVHQASYTIGIGVLCQNKDGRDVKLTTHLCLVLRLRMVGAVHLLIYVLLRRELGELLSFLPLRMN